MPADILTEALCAAITALLDDAEVALEGEHYQGALDRVEQAEAVLQMAREAGAHVDQLLALNKRIEEVAQAGADLEAELDEQAPITTTAQEYV